MIEHDLYARSLRHNRLGLPANGGVFTARLNGCLIFLLSAAYGLVLSLIPYEQFKDFENYLVYAEHSWPRLLHFMEQGILETLANEPAWLLINVVLGAFFAPETVVRTIIFISATVVAWSVLRSRPQHFIWLLAFLFLPTVLNKHLVHLRQGIAIAIFVWGWFASNRFTRVFLMALTPFVHSSFFFVLLVLWMGGMMKRIRLGPALRLVLFVALGVLVGVALEWVVAMVGARQANNYEFAMTNVSGLGFVFWFGVLGLMLMQGRWYQYKHIFEIGMVAFYLSTYWFIEVAARIFTSGMLIVLLAGLALTGWRRLGFLVVVSLYGVGMWITRIGQPALGFASG